MASTNMFCKQHVPAAQIKANLNMFQQQLPANQTYAIVHYKGKSEHGLQPTYPAVHYKGKSQHDLIVARHNDISRQSNLQNLQSNISRQSHNMLILSGPRDIIFEINLGHSISF
jgi:hypothetical protein